MSSDDTSESRPYSCGALFVGLFAALMIAVMGLAWFQRWYATDDNPTNNPTPPSPTSSAAPTSRDYVPETIPEISKDRPVAKFTVNWDKQTNALRLDASQSTPGYKYVWYFGWSVGRNTGTDPLKDPVYVTTLYPQQLENNWSTREITLTLINDARQIVATGKQTLP